MKTISKQFYKDIFSSSLIALIFSAIFILGLSLLIGFVPIGEKWLVAINQVIKVFSLLFASLLCFKERSMGAIKGPIVGLLYSLLSWLLFGTVQNSFEFTLSTGIDLLLGVVMGLIGGIFAVVFNKKVVQ